MRTFQLSSPALTFTLIAVALCALLVPTMAHAQTTTVRVESNDDRVVLRRITGTRSMSVRTYYGSAYSYSETTEEVCVSPCQAQLRRGEHRFAIVADGRRYGSWRFRIDGPTTLTFSRISRRGRRIFRALTGLAMMGAGGVMMWRGLTLPKEQTRFPFDHMSTRAMVLTSAGGALVGIGLTLTILTGNLRDRWSAQASRTRTTSHRSGTQSNASTTVAWSRPTFGSN